MYAATLGQGVWRSDDGGRTFAPLPSFGNDLVWSVAASASDRNDDLGTVYAGTQMSALYKSTDGGDSFIELMSVQDIPTKPNGASRRRRHPPRPPYHP